MKKHRQSSESHKDTVCLRPRYDPCEKVVCGLDQPLYMGQWIPGASGGEFHVGPHIMVVSPHPEDLQDFTRGGRNGTYIIDLPRPRSGR